jgi:hypothetical protein
MGLGLQPQLEIEEWGAELDPWRGVAASINPAVAGDQGGGEGD